MLAFIGRRSAFIVFVTGFLGLFLAVVEIMLSAYIVKLLSMIGVGKSGSGLVQSLLGFFNSTVEILIGFLLITALRSLLHVAKGYCAVSANEIFVTRLRWICISSTLNKLGPKYNSSRVYSLISDVFLKSALSFYGVAHAIPLIVQVILLFIFLISLSTYLSVIGLLFVCLAGLAVYVVQRNIALIVRPLSKINDSLYQSLKRVLENLLLIRFCKLELIESLHVIKLFRDYLYRVRKSNLLALISENIPSLLGSLVIVVLFYIQLEDPKVSAEIFIAFVYVFIRFVQSLSQVVSFLSTALINLPYFKSSFHYFRKLPEESLKNIDLALTEQPVNYQENYVVSDENSYTLSSLSAPSITVRNLNYGYDNDSSVFREFNLSVKAGMQCVIAGPSGVGKSTLLNLLVGEIQPLNGQVRIDDLEPEVFLDRYSHGAAYAGPAPLLFEGTIRKNLIYGARSAISDEDIINMLKSLSLSDWLEKFDSNLDLTLGDGGVGISSGQAQRLSIARALLRQPKLLILDEVTANLDFKTEARVLELLEHLKGKTTVILVTHSAEMMKNADILIDLSKNELGALKDPTKKVSEYSDKYEAI